MGSEDVVLSLPQIENLSDPLFFLFSILIPFCPKQTNGWIEWGVPQSYFPPCNYGYGTVRLPWNGLFMHMIM